MSTWKKGLSWTKGHWEKATDKNGNFVRELWVCSGPFYYNPALFGIWEVYAGCRPTATWVEGEGNEGWFPGIAWWLKRHGFGNIGFARRPSSMLN